jgi:LIVCS family branched-chain amino acid:cation transporter
MDLLAAFFFAPIIISSLSRPEEEKDFNRFVLKASAIGAFLLASIYVGFCYLAYFYALELKGIAPDGLLGAIAIKVLGPHAGLIVSLTVTIACLSTALALIAAFANFMKNEVLEGKIDYVPLLIVSLLMTFAVTTLKFEGIAHFLNPILELCYPALILLTFYNLLMPIPLEKKP